jgi:hypothetical protein
MSPTRAPRQTGFSSCIKKLINRVFRWGQVVADSLFLSGGTAHSGLSDMKSAALEVTIATEIEVSKRSMVRAIIDCRLRVIPRLRIWAHESSPGYLAGR